MTPYQYCANNPLVFIDPSGMVFDFSETPAKIRDIASRQVDEAIDYLIKNGACEEAQVLIDLRDRPDIVVKMDVRDKDEPLFSGQYYPSIETIEWSPYTASVNTDGSTQSPALSLLHEGGHALRHLLAKQKSRDKGCLSIEEAKMFNDGKKGTDEQYQSREEKRVVTEIETPAAIKLGEGTRTDHKTIGMFRVSGPTSRTPVDKSSTNKRSKK